MSVTASVGLKECSMIDKGKKNVLGILVNAINYEAAIAKFWRQPAPENQCLFRL